MSVPQQFVRWQGEGEHKCFRKCAPFCTVLLKERLGQTLVDLTPTYTFSTIVVETTTNKQSKQQKQTNKQQEANKNKQTN